MKRTWKPLDVNGLRLYKVQFSFVQHPNFNKEYVVAAGSPSDAARVMEDAYKEVIWIEKPIIQGLPLKVFQPESWWDNEDESPDATQQTVAAPPSP